MQKNREIPLAIYYALFSLFKIYFTLCFWKNHLFLSSFRTEKSLSGKRTGIDQTFTLTKWNLLCHLTHPPGVAKNNRSYTEKIVIPNSLPEPNLLRTSFQEFGITFLSLAVFPMQKCFEYH